MHRGNWSGWGWSSCRTRCCRCARYYMCLAQWGAGCPIGVELPLTETDHLWLEHFIHETPPGFQEPSYTVLHPQDQMLEKLEMELWDNMGGHWKNCRRGKGWVIVRADGEAIVRLLGGSCESFWEVRCGSCCGEVVRGDKKRGCKKRG